MSCLLIALSMTEKMYIERKKSIFYSLDVQHCILVVRAYWFGGGARAMRKRPADQSSLKLPRKRLISYRTVSGKTAATAMDKELNTR